MSVIFNSILCFFIIIISSTSSTCFVCARVSCCIVIDDNNHCETAQLFVPENTCYACALVFFLFSFFFSLFFGWFAPVPIHRLIEFFIPPFLCCCFFCLSITYFKVWINEVEPTLIFTSRFKCADQVIFGLFFFSLLLITITIQSSVRIRWNITFK